MKKQIAILLFILFSIIILDQAGNNFFARASANGAFSTTGIDTINQYTFNLYPPEVVGMSSVTLARIDSIVTDGIKARA